MLLLAGCDQTWNLDHIYEDKDAAVVDAARDGTPIDAPFDAATDCPMEYDRPLFPGSRYRLLTTPIAVWDAYDACIDDRSCTDATFNCADDCLGIVP